jgi:hypothetical protein
MVGTKQKSLRRKVEMSEKARQKDDAANKNKKSQRMQEVEKEPDKKNAATRRQDKTGRGMGKQ